MFMHLLAPLVRKHHNAVDQGEDGMVVPKANVLTGVHLQNASP